MLTPFNTFVTAVHARAGQLGHQAITLRGALVASLLVSAATAHPQIERLVVSYDISFPVEAGQLHDLNLSSGDAVNTRALTPTVQYPFGIASDPAGPGTVYVIDQTTLWEVTNIDTGAVSAIGPHNIGGTGPYFEGDIAFDRVGGQLYAADKGVIHRLSTSGGGILSSHTMTGLPILPLNSNLDAMAFDNAGQLWVVQSSSTASTGPAYLLKIDTSGATWPVTSTVQLQTPSSVVLGVVGGTGGMSFHPTTGVLWFADGFSSGSGAGDPSRVFTVNTLTGVMTPVGDGDAGITTGISGFAFHKLPGDVWVEDTPYTFTTQLPDLGREPDVAMAAPQIPMWTSRAMWNRTTPQPGTPVNHVNPVANIANYLHVHVGNRGCRTVNNTTVEVWGAPANTGLCWPCNFQLIGTPDFLPSVAAGGSATATIQWFPVAQPAHYCLVVRLVSTDDPMSFPETADLVSNVRNNNNIAWRNMTVVDCLHNIDDEVEFGVANIAAGPASVDLLFEGDGGEFLANGGSLTFDLGDLFLPWQVAGGLGSNITLTGTTSVALSGFPARIEGIPMQIDQDELVRMRARLHEPVQRPGTSSAFDLHVAQIVAGERVGGMAVQISARALQTDTDMDGIYDITDPDDDEDLDEDGVELATGTNPLDPTSTPTLIGVTYCIANPNSSGAGGVIVATGSERADDNSLLLHAVDLPRSSFGFFLVSAHQTFVAHAGGSSGNLCVGPTIGRGPGGIFNTSSNGFSSAQVDLTALPQPTGPVMVQPGETWFFQAWFRDIGSTSNFTDGVSISFF